MRNLSAVEFLDKLRKFQGGSETNYWYDNFTMKCLFENDDFAPVNLTVSGGRIWAPRTNITSLQWLDVIPFTLNMNFDDDNSHGLLPRVEEIGSCLLSTNPQRPTLLDPHESRVKPPNCCVPAYVGPLDTVTAFTCFTTTSLTITPNTLETILNTTFSLSWCKLRLCAKRYEQVTVENRTLKAGTIKEFTLSMVTNTSSAHNYSDKFNLDSQLYGDDWIFANQSLPEQFIIGNGSREVLWLKLLNRLELWDTMAQFEDFIISSGWPKFYDAVATAGSALIRNPANPSAKTISGPAYKEITFVRVRWVWLVLPLSLAVGSVLFLILTAWQSRNKPYLYKTSILPFLFHPMDDLKKERSELGLGERTTACQRETGDGLLKVAKRRRAKLGQGAEGNMELKIAD